METKTKALALTLVFATAAFLLDGNAPLGALLWPPAKGMPVPTSGQVALFMVYTVLRSIVFGVGAAWLLLGWSYVRRAAASLPSAALAYVAVAWVTMNWVPHDNLHMAVGMDLNALIALEYGFHLSLMVAGLALMPFVGGVFEQAARGRPAARTATVSVRTPGAVQR